MANGQTRNKAMKQGGGRTTRTPQRRYRKSAISKKSQATNPPAIQSDLQPDESVSIGYEWGQIFSTIALRIAQDGKNKNGGFIERTLELLKDKKELTPAFFKDSSKDIIKDDVDPFSFFALLNFNGKKRKKILEIIQENASTLGLASFKIPPIIYGIPKIRHPAVFFNEKPDRNKKLWKLFCVAMKCNQSTFDPGFEDAFNDVKGLYGPNRFTTTIILFAMQPEVFLTLDENTRRFLSNPDNSLDKSYKAILDGTAPDGGQYVQICASAKKDLLATDELANKGITSFAKLSYNAWKVALFLQAKDLLLSSDQLILTGAPGTGKTHTAREIADTFVDDNRKNDSFLGNDVKKEDVLQRLFGNDYSELFPDLEKLPNEPDKLLKSIFIDTIQFHPGYDYSDFAIGMKPVLLSEKSEELEMKNGKYVVAGTKKAVPDIGKAQVSFRWKDGTFKKFAVRAMKAYKTWEKRQASEKPKGAPRFVFVIDEINRADLSRVFGELFSLLEEDYRYPNEMSKPVTLPNGEEFVIPANLYIIGTMNDIDRSVESMDFALRRRFAWLEVPADESKSIIEAWAGKNQINPEIVAKLEDAMDALNECIRGETELSLGEKKDKRSFSLKSKLGSEYELGGAYFKKFAGKNGSKDDYEKLWNNHLKIILGEYLRGDKDKCDIMDALHNVYLDACGF